MKKTLILFICAGFLAAGSQVHAQSPYIQKVYDFMPAPGQFTNDMPPYSPGDTKADMIRKAEECLAGNQQLMVSLGGYGGYIVFGFDHPVRNIPGKYDFKILGNAFYANDNPNGEASKEGGSCEPGIVMVSRDANANGIPDDPWYELAGSEYRKPETIHNYEITYHKPDENKTPDPDYPHIMDSTYIRWTTNGHGDGYLFRNIYHLQSYYPQWMSDETLVFSGTKLADNYIDESGQGTYFVQYAYHWGYADNQPNTDDRSNFNIEWAVDANGQTVALSEIHFVKVYTGLNQNCGWIGETSTEIMGATDLHLAGGDTDVPVFAAGIALNQVSATLQPGQTLTLAATINPANATNKAITWKSLSPDVATVSDGTVTAISEGITVIQAITNDGYHIAACLVTVEFPKPEVIAVTGVTLDRNQLTLKPGDWDVLTATVIPDNAANKTVHWSSSNATVAEVTVNGLVYAFTNGTSVITVSTEDGDFRAACTLTVDNGAGIGDILNRQPTVYHADGHLYPIGLEGYDCIVFSVDGQKKRVFRIASPQKSIPCTLPPGIYLLEANKAGNRKVFKIVVK